MKKHSFLQQRGPDALTEELIKAFSGEARFEFKALFLVVYERLRSRKVANGGEEMLRLRLYEKLQLLVRLGGVAKDGKVYHGDRAGLLRVAEHFAAKLLPIPKATPSAS